MKTESEKLNNVVGVFEEERQSELKVIVTRRPVTESASHAA